MTFLEIGKAHHFAAAAGNHGGTECGFAVQVIELPNLYPTFAGGAILRICIGFAHTVKRGVGHHQRIEQGIIGLVIISHLVHREDVNPQAGLNGAAVPGDVGFAYGALAIAHPSERDPAVLKIPAIVELETLGAVGGRKSLVILAQHLHVYVIIPRDETLVAHRTKAGPVGEGIVYAVSLAKLRNIYENLEAERLYLLQTQFLHHLAIKSSETSTPLNQQLLGAQGFAETFRFPDIVLAGLAGIRNEHLVAECKQIRNRRGRNRNPVF